MGWKTSYYQNTYDFKGEEDTVQPAGLEETVVDTQVNGVTMNGTMNGHVNGHVNGHANGGEAVQEPSVDGEECEACNI
jgi:hypothetical protein